MQGAEDAVYGPLPDFITSWDPHDRVYGILHLLQCRAVMPSNSPKPAEVAHLKYLATASSGHGKKHKSHKASASKAQASTPALEDAAQNDASGSAGGIMAPEVHDGELAEVFEEAGGAGSWWRILGQDEMLVRKDISLFSQELRRLKPGSHVQQSGHARRFVSGQMNGIVRLPVRPSGWVTADARAAGGPRFLEPTEAPRWLVVYESGLPHGDVLVRAGSDLDSKEVAVLRHGDVVEQIGSQETHSGVVRMPVAVPEGAATLQGAGADAKSRGRGGSSPPSGATGWVTVDARGAGGPVFLRSLSV